MRISNLWLVSVLVVALAGWMSACGGGQQPVAEERVETRAPARVEAPPARQIDDRIWYVFYMGIHSLTIYPEPGPIRAYDREGGVYPFGTQHPRFSVMSEYREREAHFAPFIAEAETVEELVRRLATLPDVEVEQEVNPIYEDR